MLTPKEKEKIIKGNNLNKKDTGSADVQIVLLSEQIKNLLNHLKIHPKDQHSRHGLLKMLVKRRKLLLYLERASKRRYNNILKKVGLKK